jgi:hypothetical protein
MTVIKTIQSSYLNISLLQKNGIRDQGVLHKDSIQTYINYINNLYIIHFTGDITRNISILQMSLQLNQLIIGLSAKKFNHRDS